MKRYAILVIGNVRNFQSQQESVAVRAYSVDWLLPLLTKVILTTSDLRSGISVPRFITTKSPMALRDTFFNDMTFPTKEEFTTVSRSITPVSPLLQTAISYKSSIQREIIPLLTTDQMMDVKYSRKNEDVVRMLIHLGYQKFSANPSTENLYCASIAVATIIKEYEWGIEYLIGDGLYKLAKRVYDNY